MAGSPPMAVAVVWALALTASATPLQGWQHGWATPTDFWWGDFGYTLLTDAQATFLTKHYRVVSLEKCTGQRQGVLTEEGIMRTAKQLKAIDPAVKVIFYWSVVQAGIGCYAANATLAQHPEWLLKTDAGVAVSPPRIDLTIDAAREWWLSVPFNKTAGWEPGLIDGILADDSGFNSVAGMSQAREQAQYAAKHTILAAMQEKFHDDPSHGIVMGNGLSEYDQDPEDPHNLDSLKYMDAIQNEHFAVFEQLYPNGSVRLDKAADDLNNIEWAARNKSKSVFCSFWPGPIIGFEHGNPMWPNHTEPTTPDGWRQALLDNIVFPLAAFLTVADTNTFMTYALWYEVHQGFVPCPSDPTSCDTPQNWYPELSKPLGAPLEPRQAAGAYRWTRRFAHADVVLDLVSPKLSSITWHA